tara:strand:- start:115 stop:330 length:216 start_codon:yes stop_codon:yes gene_type:complete
MLLKFNYFFEIFFALCIFLVRGIVDKMNEIINSNVIPTRLQNVIPESSNSPNDTVRYKFNFDKLAILLILS